MEAITWGEAIIESYMSDIEEMDEETQQNLNDEVSEMVIQY